MSQVTFDGQLIRPSRWLDRKDNQDFTGGTGLEVDQPGVFAASSRQTVD